MVIFNAVLEAQHNNILFVQILEGRYFASALGVLCPLFCCLMHCKANHHLHHFSFPVCFPQTLVSELHQLVALPHIITYIRYVLFVCLPQALVSELHQLVASEDPRNGEALVQLVDMEYMDLPDDAAEAASWAGV